MPNPVLVRHTAFSWAQGSTTTLTKYPLPEPVLSGNLVIIVVNVGSGNTPTSVTDDQSNTYTLGPSVDNASQKLAIYYKANVTNGPKRIDVSWSPAAPWTNIAVSEWANIATATPTDGSNSNSGSGTSLTTGSITTGTSGDLIFAAFIQSGQTTFINSYTAGSGMTLLNASLHEIICTEYQIQTSAGAINPALTMSPTNGWCACVIAFKQAAAGTVNGAEIRVLRIQHESLTQADGTPFKYQFPCSGNLLVLIGNTVSAAPTAVSDTNSNTWVQVTGSPLNSDQAGFQCIWYAANATTSHDLAITITKSGTSDDAFLFFDIINAATIGTLGNTSTAGGTVPSATSWSGGTLDPATSPSLILIQNGVQSNTVLTLSPGVLLAAVDNEETSPWFRDQNNGPSMYYSSTGAQFTNSWTSDIAPDDWGDLMAEFLTTPGLAIVEQEGSRYRADTGDEAGAPFLGDQDAHLTADVLINRRLRAIISVTNNSAAAQYQLEMRRIDLPAWRKVT